MLRGTDNQIAIVPPNRRLVLLDINMPRMNGLEFLEAIRADAQLCTLPVVILTTSDQERDRLQAYRYNVAGYLIKPILFDAFSTLIFTFSQYWTLSEMPCQ